MRRVRRIAPLALLVLVVLLQCKRDPPDDDPGNTETGEDLDPDEVLDVAIRPTFVRIDTATPIDLKAHATTRDGGWYDTAGGTWHSTNDQVATIDDQGHLVPVAPGQVLIEYRWEGVSAEPATVEVVEPGTIDVQVVDWLDHTPLAGIDVGLSTDASLLVQGTTDEEGRVTLTGDFSGPVTLTAWTEAGYRYSSLAQVAPRQVLLPMYPSPAGFEVGRMQGEIQFDEDDVVAGSVAIGLAVPSVPESPIFITAKDLLGRNQSLDGYGLNWTVPENIQINGIVDEFQGDVEPGDKVVFAAGGVYDLSIALELALALEEYGTGALFPVMTGHIEQLRFGVSEPHTFEPDGEATDIEIPLLTELPLSTSVDVAAPPAGHYWPDPILVLSWREYEDLGHVAVGFGTGDHPYLPDDEPPGDDDDNNDDDDATWAAVGQLEERVWVTVREVARDGVFEDVPTRHYAFIAEDGVDYGNRGSAVISPPTTRDRVRLPDFLDLIDTHLPEEQSWEFRWDPPDGTDMGWMIAWPTCVDYDIEGWFVYGPAMDGFRFPQGLPMLTPDSCAADEVGTKFSPEAFSLELVSYQSMINAHDEDLTRMWTYANRRTYASQWAPGVAFP